MGKTMRGVMIERLDGLNEDILGMLQFGVDDASHQSLDQVIQESDRYYSENSHPGVNQVATSVVGMGTEFAERKLSYQAMHEDELEMKEERSDEVWSDEERAIIELKGRAGLIEVRKAREALEARERELRALSKIGKLSVSERLKDKIPLRQKKQSPLMRMDV